MRILVEGYIIVLTKYSVIYNLLTASFIIKLRKALFKFRLQNIYQHNVFGQLCTIFIIPINHEALSVKSN